MPKTSSDTATGGGEFGPVTDRSEKLDGGYTVNFVTFNDDIDATPLLKGLPDDRCQCPHWGYVVSGSFTMRFGDRTETFRAGDAWYAPPGHVPIQHDPGTQVVQFSPTHELEKTEAAMQQNMAAMRG
jgi:glyoxylate utilization-related uncharacterized protein